MKVPFVSNIDWMAKYNKLLEREGESSEIGCLIENLNNKKIDYKRFNHTDTDGLSCVIMGLRSSGIEINEFPKNSYSRNLSKYKILLLFKRFIVNEVIKKKVVTWKYSNIQKPFKTIGPFFHCFSVEDTQVLKKKSRKLGGNISTLLMFSVNKIVNKHLLEGEAKVSKWYVPMNMRGLYTGPTEGSNHISNIVLDINKGDNLKDVFIKKLRELRSGYFLISFFFLNIGNYWPFKNALRNKVKKDYFEPETSGSILGSYAYLGEWPPKDQNNELEDLMIYPFGNVSLKNPICCSSLIWKGKLTFSLQFHSSISGNKNKCEKILESVVNYLNEVKNE